MMLSEIAQTIKDHEFVIRDLELKEITLKDRIINSEKDLDSIKENLELYTQAHELSIIILKRCQTALKNKVEGLVSLCLRDIMGDEYSFEMEFETKRGQLECTPIILYKDRKLDPKLSVGGGIIDICGTALKIINWYLDPDKTDKLIVLDEPFRHLSPSKQLQASQVLKSLSSLLNIQLLIITHSERLALSANIIYKTEKEDGKTTLLKTIL